jgi:undecaprenyl-phosphate galactose phosphotransferase/putative colanic acid biosynthesis UDP-glucose lipid carrier transferase
MSDAARRDQAALVDPRGLTLPEVGQPARRWLPFQLIEPLTQGCDFIIILTAVAVSGMGYQWLILDTIGDLTVFLAIGVLVFANFFALTSAQDNYLATNLINLGRQVRYTTLNWLFIFLTLTAVAFTLKTSGTFSRGATLSSLVVGWGSLIAFRFFLSGHLERSLAEGTFAQKRIVLISEHGDQSISHALAELRQCGYLPVKTCELTLGEIDATGMSRSLVYKIEDVISAAQRQSADYVFLLLKWDQPHLINNIVRMLRALPIPVHLLPDENVATFLAARAGNVGRTFTVELQRAPLTAPEQMLKRSFDFSAAAITLVLLAPLMLMTALLIKLDSRGPAFFKQKRNGFNGSVFSIYKFRSMRVLEDGDRIRQATRNDPRVTRMGRWLRSTSIDELPQLLNVLLGDMSIVGPRPHAIAHNNEYQALVSNYAFRHHMKPGITGWAQVHGFRGETRTIDMMAKRIDNDLWYINHWSLWLDLRIVLKTVMLAFSKSNAY